MTDDSDLLVLEPVAPPAPTTGRSRRRLRRGMVSVAAVVAAVATVATVAGSDHSDHTAIDDEVPPAPRTPAIAVAPAPGGGGTETAAAPPPTRPPPGPVVEDLALRADGGLGPYAAGAARGEVVDLAGAMLGPPGAAPAPRGAPCAADPSLTVTEQTEWDDLVLTFAGTTGDDLRLVGWESLARRGAARRFRLAGGPAIGDPLTAWRAAYGADLEVHDRLAGDGGQTRVTVHLPEGDVALFGGARASAFAYLARAGLAC